MTEEAAPLADHSPISASGMYRWSVCPGSVALSFGAPSTSSSFALDGTAAHSLGEACFAENIDAWEYIGHHFKGVEVDKDMADAVQVYLDAVRVRHPNRDQGNSWIERSFHCGAIHDQMYGTSDLVYYNQGQRSLDVWDYKHGAGIVVDVQENPQLMYYGVGMLEDLDLWGKVDKVTLHIAQPRGWHPDGPIRSWTISTEALAKWRDEVLLPAMELAQTSTETISGPHCRFCPARAMACPAIAADMDELEELMTEFTERGGAEGLSNEQVGRFLVLRDTAEMVCKEVSRVAFHRLNAGTPIPGRKLVMSRTNRAWQEGAEDVVVAAMGWGSAYAPGKLKTPAQIEKLAGGTALTDEWSMKPEGKLTVAPESDKRAEVDRDVSKLFEPVEEK
jgi:hypothetical protein